jgi:hypothetical protein
MPLSNRARNPTETPFSSSSAVHTDPSYKQSKIFAHFSYISLLLLPGGVSL